MLELDEVIQMYIDHFGVEPNVDGKGSPSDWIEILLDAIDNNEPLEDPPEGAKL